MGSETTRARDSDKNKTVPLGIAYLAYVPAIISTATELFAAFYEYFTATTIGEQVTLATSTASNGR